MRGRSSSSIVVKKPEKTEADHKPVAAQQSHSKQSPHRGIQSQKKSGEPYAEINMAAAVKAEYHSLKPK